MMGSRNVENNPPRRRTNLLIPVHVLMHLMLMQVCCRVLVHASPHVVLLLLSFMGLLQHPHDLCSGIVSRVMPFYSLRELKLVMYTTLHSVSCCCTQIRQAAEV